MPGIIDLLKRIPIDLGQQAVADRTKGKQIALSLIPDGRGEPALDVGARAGVQTAWLRARGYEVTPIDTEETFDGCLAVDANEPLPFENETFSLIWCSEVIEHLIDPPAVVHEFRRILRPGGLLIMTTPNSYAWLFRLIALFGLTPQRIQRKDHLHFFSASDISNLTPDASVYGYFPYAVVKFTIHRFVGALSPTFVLRIQKPTAPITP